MATESFGIDSGLSFDRHEFTGAVGDSITVLPVVVALAATTKLSLAPILVLFGVFQVVWGVRYGLPMSVEPMKALSALAIAGALSTGEFVAAGLLAGVTLLVLGGAGVLDRIAEYVGQPVVRGVQLAVALLLLKTGAGLAVTAPETAALGLGVAAVVALAGYRRAAALAVLAVGVGATLAATGTPTPQFPSVASFVPVAPAPTRNALSGTLAQLAMTVGNAAVATSLLCADHFDADVSPDRLARSMGAMSLVSVPLGGVPMCHGSGGLAGKHAFGARTGGANVILGAGYVLAAFVAAGLVAAFPVALLGVLLFAVAASLGRTALDTDSLALTVGVGVLGLVVNVGVAFVVGVGAWLVLERRRGETQSGA